MKKEFKFSVIMPIYNVENYLEEAIQSIVNQTINFEENIQLIFVNDGSPDNSEKICLKYKKLYPDNIIYIKQKNSGVSIARNRGKQEAVGKYINFFDSDDIWDLKTFDLVYNFFEKHYDEIDLVSCRLVFFGTRNAEHPLNFKYKEDAIIDVSRHPDFIQLSASSAFIKRTAISSLEFDSKVSYSEDALLLTQLILRKGRYGVIKEGIYFYRRRAEENSAVQQSNQSYEWYFGTPEKAYKFLIEKSKKDYGFVSTYIQNYVMYEIQWRLKNAFSPFFSEKDKEKYMNVINNLLVDIDDDIILSQKNMSSEYKLYALSMKHDQQVNRQLLIKKNSLYYEDYKLHDLINTFSLKINIITANRNFLILDGQFRTVLDKRDYEIYAQDNEGKKYPIVLNENHLSPSVSIDKIILQSNSFELKVPIKNNLTVSMYLKYKDYAPVRLRYNFYQHSKLSNKNKLFYSKDRKIIFNAGHSIIKVINQTFLKKIHMQFRTQWDFFKHKHYKEMLLRFITVLVAPFFRRPIWLVSDRLSFANDNGRQFFKFIRSQNNRDINVYFVINKKSKDYKDLKEIGKVVHYNSLKYKVLFLLSSKIISSSAEDWVINPFKKRREMYKDLYTFDFIFLQHGVIKNNLSSWLHKFNKNITLFITSADLEKESIINGDYGYTEKEVKITGLSRFDKLVDKTEKKIVIMPTWRKGLVGEDCPDVPGERVYNELFKESNYVKFYNSLINHPKLLEVMRNSGYSGDFIVHPSHLKQDCDFVGNDCFKIHSGFANYTDYFNASALLITDYSSVAMDFAYLNKPVIYCQFDEDSFYEKQIYSKGYFDDRKDGFGPVCTTLDETVATIISELNRGCIQEEVYNQRVQNFYKYHDRKNSQRIYDEILKLPNK